MNPSHHYDHVFLTAWQVNQRILTFSSSPKENNLTIVSPPLVRLYISNDTIAERGSGNQHKTNTMMKELREFWLSDFENRLIKSKEFSTYHFVHHDLTFLHIWCVIRWNSDIQRTIDSLFTTTVMEWHCSELFRGSLHISVHISNGDCQFPLLSYMGSRGLTGTISGVLFPYLALVLPYLACLYVTCSYLACLQILLLVTRFHITNNAIQQSLYNRSKNIYSVDSNHEEFAF